MTPESRTLILELLGDRTEDETQRLRDLESGLKMKRTGDRAPLWVRRASKGAFEEKIGTVNQDLARARAARTEFLALEPRIRDLESGLGPPLSVVARPLLVSGQLRQTRDGLPVILIDSEQPADQQLLTLWHEVVHLLRCAGGFDQDESSVEEAAARLAAACPEALAWVGISLTPDPESGIHAPQP